LKENTILKIKHEACTNTIIKDIFLIKPNEWQLRNSLKI
jgi:hypothetical protein